MDRFTILVNDLDSMIWSMSFVVLCLGVGLYLSISLKFVQIRLLKDMVSLLFGDKRSDHGISSFQSFATTVGARVGMGNIAGVATAIFIGGPGSIFWMWMITFIGAASAFTESTLAQAYKIRNKTGEFIGGPAYYIQRGMKNKGYAILYACIAFLGPGVLLPGVQINSLVMVFEEAFGVDRIMVGGICCVLLAFIIFGSIKRIARLAEFLTPFMCLIYMSLAGYILLSHITELPDIFMTIIASAVGMDQVFAGIVGSAVSWGVKRGIYSNEAGMGCGAIVSAAAECSHPAKQGLVQAFSIYVDTLFVGTASALIILFTKTYDVTDGVNLIVNNTNGLEAGIKWAQYALINTYGEIAGQVLAIIIVMFVFSSLTGYCYQAESNVSYITDHSKKAIFACRLIFVAASFFGACVTADAIWAMGDIGYGLMGWANIIAITILAPKAVKILKDYEKQKKKGKDPVFDPEKFGIKDKSEVWKK